MRRQFTDCDVKCIATIEMFMPVAQEVGKALKDYKGTIWVGGNDDKAQGKKDLQATDPKIVIFNLREYEFGFSNTKKMCVGT